MLVCDLETLTILPGLLAPPPVVFSFVRETGAPWLALPEDGCDELECALYAGELLIFHNGPFDLAVACAHRPRLISKVFQAYADGRIRDTISRQQLLDIAAGRREDNGQTFAFRKGQWVKADYKLASLELLYTGRDRSDDKNDPNAWRMRYGELAGVPLDQWPEKARTYALEDAVGPRDVFLAQGPETLTNEVEQVRAAWALHLQSAWGLRTDGDSVRELETKLLAAKKISDRRLHQARFFKPKSATKDEVAEGKVDFYAPPKKPGGPERPMRWAKDMARITGYVERTYQRRHGKPAPKTPAGRISTDKDTMAESGSVLLAALSGAGGVDKILSTYVPALKQGTVVPINTGYNPLVNTGRTSSFRPNIQNLPTGRRVGGVRECFTARPGTVLVSVDYDVFEIRALAQVCLWLFKQSRMADELHAKKEIHLAMAGGLLRIPYEEAMARYAAKDPALKKARDAAKVANFGIPGGLGVKSLMDYARTGYGVILTEEQAVKLKRDYLEMWPEMRLYFQYVSGKVGGGDAEMTQFFSGRVRGGLNYTQACNTLFQGLAADAAKNALFQVARESYVDCGTALFGCRPVGFIHDEILAEVPEDVAHEAAMRLAEVMCSAAQEVIPDVPITASPALMARWYKGAEAVYDAAGRLVPWAPKAA